MADPVVSVDVLDSVRSVTVDVTIQIRNLWRFRLGCGLLRLAGRVLRCPVVVQLGDSDSFHLDFS